FELTLFFFFFQAEDGIRDFHVTGVQTCALPIWRRTARVHDRAARGRGRGAEHVGDLRHAGREVRRRGGPGGRGDGREGAVVAERSEERRVGKECRSWRGAYQHRERGRTTSPR